MQFLSDCKQSEFTCFWLQKSKQWLGFFESPLYICCLIIRNLNVTFIYLLVTIKVMRSLGVSQIGMEPPDPMVFSHWVPN